MTRLSRWLMKIAGQNTEELIPRTDLEKGLAAIAENGGGNSGPFIEEKTVVILPETEVEFIAIEEVFVGAQVSVSSDYTWADEIFIKFSDEDNPIGPLVKAEEAPGAYVSYDGLMAFGEIMPGLGTMIISLGTIPEGSVKTVEVTAHGEIINDNFKNAFDLSLSRHAYITYEDIVVFDDDVEFTAGETSGASYANILELSLPSVPSPNDIYFNVSSGEEEELTKVSGYIKYTGSTDSAGWELTDVGLNWRLYRAPNDESDVLSGVVHLTLTIRQYPVIDEDLIPVFETLKNYRYFNNVN